MIVRVAIEGIESTIDLEDSSWTPELVQTFLRLSGDEVMRVCESVGVVIGRDAADAELAELLGEDEEGEAGESDTAESS